ncbi:CaiB/BaiF CoA-transferase family protein [Gottfriedia acidiceleris]|uniref:CaiB/BaiF CoA transferase family protein n=1 Tax=Bacillaceae TaxID=186817 RepID=UPI000BEC6744|nr:MULTISPECIES: CaiB/BaiF CoA-transferase family protein [unclassified Bacillus (in: firmicutes)]PEC50020.1 carnitine dehydratase [Bacillus sp. AFS096315]PFM79307.1 carnitine dehydratase [Bacillus sp. AFS077874]
MLNKLKILDFTRLLPGPYATMILADLGAEVLRIESPYHPDLLQTSPPFDGDQSASHQAINRSKKSITLDLKSEEGTEIIYKLVKEYDIVIEQFRPGVLEKLGLSYEQLKKINSKLIYCSITGYGQTGPYRNRAGHDNNYLSLTGVLSYSTRKNERPVPMGIQIADQVGGSLHAIIGILAAVIHREQTGEGQWVDISMTDCTFALQSLMGSGWLTQKINPKSEEHLLNGGVFYDYYETADGRFFSVGSLEPSFRKQLCEALEIMPFLPYSFSEEKDEIDLFKNEVKRAFSQKTFNELKEIFSKFDACVEPVLTFEEACDHPQVKERGLLVNVQRNDGTNQLQIGTPFKYSVFKPTYQHVGVKPGTNSKEVLLNLGYDDQTINRFIEKGVIRSVD